jgi:AraC family transcriptional regulator
MNSAEERAIRFLYEKYSEPLSLADIANSAILSRFHFCRTFRDATGVTPGRFLSAIRIYQAKRLLLNTRMSVTDIAFAVGYNSLGSFSNHFTESVGIAPGRFRRISLSGGFKLPRPREAAALPAERESAAPHAERESAAAQATVTGTIAFPRGYVGGRVYLGVFDTPIVQRQPAASVIVEASAATFQLADVPEGTWFLRAVAVADNVDPEPWTRRTLLIGGVGPMTVAAGAVISARIELRPRRSTDLPILLALPDLEPQVTDIEPDQAGLVAVPKMRSAPC